MATHLKVIASILTNISGGLILTLFTIKNNTVLLVNIIFVMISYLIAVRLEQILKNI